MSEELNSYMLKTAKGDKESFRFIANALGYKMHATAIKILGSAHFDYADDVVQISLIKIWQSAPRWVNKGSVEGYVYKIVFSTCMDFIRRYKRSEEFKDKITVCKMDVDANRETAAEYGIRSIPTLMIFEKGSLVGTEIGALTKSQLDEFIRSKV